MRVLLLNGSPNKNGCTYTALSEAAGELMRQGVEAEIFQLGAGAVCGCTGCRKCAGKGRCVFTDDGVNKAIELAEQADGFIFGSPVYYASANGAFSAFLDRMFFSGGQAMRYKPAACVVSARRAGTTAALDQLMKYPLISQMPVVSSQYWCMVHGNTPDEVKRDLEGMQVMRTLGKNMAWILKCIELGKASGLAHPDPEAKIHTNFIR